MQSSAPQRTSAELALAEIYAKAKSRLPGDDTIAVAREAAFARFVEVGLPHRHVEAWRYTDLRAKMDDAKALALSPGASARARAAGAGKAFSKVPCRRLSLVDGAFAADLSDLADLEEGLTIRPMAEALAAGDALVLAHLGKVVATDDSLVEVNAALMGDGLFVHIAPDARISRPLHLTFVTAGEKPAAMFMRSLVIVEPGAAVTLVESYEGMNGGDYQLNTALELVIGEGARVDHVKIADDSAEALHVATLMAAIGARARFNDFTLTIGGAVVRNQMFLRFDGEGTVADIRGANLLKGQQHADTALVAEHVAGACESREVFKSVLDGKSRGVFQGRITVRASAQKTDARMMSKALLLSESAEVDNKPELEIFADDVKCGHGATAGALDEELKFYLMARGIPASEAEALLIEGFVGEAIDVIAHDGLRGAVVDATAAWLAGRG